MEYKEALSRAAAFCAATEHCRSEVVEKLEQWEVDPEHFATILEYLELESYLNEVRYAECYVRDKYRINKWGRVKISYALRLKKVAPAAIAQGMEQIDEELYFENLLELLRAKQRTTKAKDPYDEKSKLFRFAGSRGFDSEEIQRALRLLTEA